MAIAIKHLRSWLRRLTPPAASYRVYTRDFDVTIRAENLESVLGPMSAADHSGLDEAWAAFSGALQGWRTRANLIALEASSRIRSSLGASMLAGTAVTILIDQSGSMRGQKMLL